MLFGKLRARLKGDWCVDCQTPYDKLNEGLYLLPQSVAHYVSRGDAAYYQENLHKVNCRADIPAGIYACRAIAYRCPSCGKRETQIKPFLQVRDQEKAEEVVTFNQGELDEFLSR